MVKCNCGFYQRLTLRLPFFQTLGAKSTMVKQRKGKCTETLRSTTRTNGSRAKSLRRSPRLSNSPAAADGAPVKKRPELKSKSKALSLHVIGDDRVEDSPLPLKMYGPDAAAAADKSRRRSAMFCGQNAGRSQLSSVKSVKLLPALSHQGMGEASKRCLRRSPRLSPNLKGSGAALGWDVIEWRESSTKRRHCGENDGTRGEGVRCLRSRTVLLHGASSEPPLKKLKRLSLDSVDSKSSNVDVKYELLALPEPPKRKPNSSKEPCKKAKTASEESDWSVSVGRCLRSRTLPIQPAGTEENGESKSALSELLNVSEDKKPIAKVETAFGSVRFGLAGSEKVETESVSVEVLHGSGDKKQPKETKAVAGSCDSSVSVGRCLRSRIIPFHRVWSESEDAKFEISADQSQLKRTSSKKKGSEENGMCCFVGEPVPEEEAQERWRWRYELKSQGSKSKSWKLNAGEEDEIILNVKCHYTQANVGSCIFNLGDCAYIKGDGRQKYVGRIVEFFKTTDGEDYFRVQWFFRAEDTVMKDAAASHDKKRLFHSNLMNDNLLDCIVSKVSVIHIAPSLGLEVKSIPSGAFYYDMEYCVEYSTFRMLSNDNFAGSRDLSTPDDIEAFHSLITATPLKDLHSKAYKAELALLDLYSGCGGMSTGLCLGTKLSGVNLVTRWAVDADSSACDSLKLNHPTTQIRNETAEDFLELLKAWDKLCQWYVFNNLDRTLKSRAEETREVKSKNFASGLKIPAGEFEVLRLVDICFGDPCNTGKRGLKFKVSPELHVLYLSRV
ncbi:DNA (cytosine-5-)-methyltransferase [Bertholletia excelsa]